MCDLWKNTTDSGIGKGLIPKQIEYALARLTAAKTLKLYNSGNFFDNKAIPHEDFPSIAHLIRDFSTLIVECHPKLLSKRVIDFKELIEPVELEIAMGLETVHPAVLPLLNKRMTLSDFEQGVAFLKSHRIRTRAFLLLKPPFLSELEGVHWAKKSLDFAFETGVESCAVIPVRAGNGAMESLQEGGYFSPPAIYSLEEVLEYGIKKRAGRVFADTWDLELFSKCNKCFKERKERLEAMNLAQQLLPAVHCSCS
jgi:radical SAM enzyme (TIGR01210 family)